MSNKAFLHVCDSNRPLPAFTEAGIKADESVLLCADVCVPLLWISLFRSEDLAKEFFEFNGKRYEAVGPVVKKATALDRLADTSKQWNRILGTEWDLSNLESILHKCLKRSEGDYVSIDVFEIEAAGALSKAIKTFESGDRKKKLDVLELTTVITRRSEIYDPFDPKKIRDVCEDDYYNMMRIIGYGWYSEVPWDVFPETTAENKKWWEIWR